MEATMTSERLRIGGMTCASCQNRIETALRKTDGVLKATVSLSGAYADVTHDAGVVSLAELRAVIERLGYEAPAAARGAPSSDKLRRAAGLAIIVAALYFLASRLNLANSLPLAEAGMGYGALFVIGLLTSVHCVAMCGGINLSQCLPQTGGNLARSSLLYNLGRVASYTLIGGAVGALGSAITFSGAFKGVVQLIAGVFMVIMGVNMLGLFPRLRAFWPRLPRSLQGLVNRGRDKSRGPLVVGLLNGLMPCGPLQAMQLYALSTGSPAKGAASMLLFGLGTAPLLFGLGALSSLLSKRFTRRVMTAGAVLVTVLGLTMLTRGASLSGFSFEGIGLTLGVGVEREANALDGTVVDGVRLVRSELKSGEYPKITVQANVPVKWTINAPKGSVNGCNNRMRIPQYGIEHQFRTGENVIEFTPVETGGFSYSCWMGMIRGSITVVEAPEELKIEN
jgi:sulfite exporter TauE/SafE/copper chaperone CopZ